MNNPIYWINDFMVTALGVGTEHNAQAITDYQTGIRLLHGITSEPSLAATINWDEIPQSPNFTRLEALLIFAIQNIQRQTPIDYSSPRLGIVFSTTKGNIDLLADGLDERAFLHTMAQRVATHCGITTHPIVISNACISGLSALIVASRLIDNGDYDHIIVIGGDLLTQFVVSGFKSFKSVSDAICRPYDAARDGLSMGEACGAVLLSSNQQLAGEQPIYITGGAITNDANHISGPSRTGDGLHYAIQQAMNEANTSPQDLAFISAHGTATLYNDEMESKALALSKLSQTPTNSLKPYFGHTLGACGVIESILSVWQLCHNIIFGTMGFNTLGVPQPMNINSHHVHISTGNTCLKIASGFGGCNAALLISLQPPHNPTAINNRPIKTLRTVTISGKGDFHARIREEYHTLNAPNPKFFKMDDQCKLGYICVEQLLRDMEPCPDTTRTAIIIANQVASLNTDLQHQRHLNNALPASPAVFVYTLPNIVSGEICIRHHIQGENTFFIQNAPDGMARHYAEMLLRRSVADRVILGWCNLLGEDYSAQFQLLCIE